MLRFFIASCLLAIAVTATAEVKKEFPTWPKVYSYTMHITEPYNTPGGAKGEQVGKVWFDGEDGKVRKDFEGKCIYGLKNLNGQGAFVEVDKSGECEVNHDETFVQSVLTPTLPPVKNEAEYLGEADNVEQWKWKSEGATISIFLTMKDGVAVPVKFDIYPATPPPGSDLILPVVAVIKDFSTAKPDASVFNIDIEKCKETPKESAGPQSFKNFL